MAGSQVSRRWLIQESLTLDVGAPFCGNTGGAALSEGGASGVSTPCSLALTLVPPPLWQLTAGVYPRRPPGEQCRRSLQVEAACRWCWRQRERGTAGDPVGCNLVYPVQPDREAKLIACGARTVQWACCERPCRTSKAKRVNKRVHLASLDCMHLSGACGILCIPGICTVQPFCICYRYRRYPSIPSIWAVNFATSLAGCAGRVQVCLSGGKIQYLHPSL